MAGMVGGVKVVSKCWECNEQSGDERVLHWRQIKRWWGKKRKERGFAGCENDGGRSLVVVVMLRGGKECR